MAQSHAIDLSTENIISQRQSSQRRSATPLLLIQYFHYGNSPLRIPQI